MSFRWNDDTQGGSPRSGIVVMTDSFTSSHRHAIIRSAAQYRVPAVYPYLFLPKIAGC